MKTRFLLVPLAALALVLSTHTNSAEAGRYRLFRRSTIHHAGSRVPVKSNQMVIRANGRSLWDLGQNMGDWPTTR